MEITKNVTIKDRLVLSETDIEVDTVKAAEVCPLHPDLRHDMRAELVTGDGGEVWILHDKPLPGILLWVEYDTVDSGITLCMEDGKIQKLGIRVNELMRKCLLKAKKAYTIMTDGKTVKDMYLVPIVVRKV